MGLLDSVLGAALGGGGAGGALSSILGAALGGGGQQQQVQPDVLSSVLGGLLGNDGQHGGLGGLMGKFTQAGLGDAANSWVGNGANQQISGDQLSNVLGSDALSGIASKLGVDPSMASGILAQALPAVISHLTPNGQAPAGGLGNSGDLMGMLGSLLQHK